MSGIRVEGLGKRFGARTAVRGLSFEVRPGEVFGLLGPNGAGKTTTVRMLTGLLQPSEGEAHVWGHSVRTDGEALRRTVGLLTEQPGLYERLSARDNLRFFMKLHELDERKAWPRALAWLERFGLGGREDEPCGGFSKGMRQKLAIVRTLVHEPQVIFLDEPTIGLDVSMQATMRAFIKSYNERHGATLILTSHYMDDVAALCPRVIVIDKGQLSYDGGLEALVQRVRPEKRVVLRLSKPVDTADLAVLGKVVTRDAMSAVLQVSQEAVNATVSRALSSLPVLDLTVENAPLEEVMSELFAESKAHRVAAAAAAAAEPKTTAVVG